MRAAVDAGFDWVLGGTHATDAAALLAGSDIRYCPFPGRIIGHPSVLEGGIEEIARSAAELTALDGVHGVDLLTYRHATADAGELTAAVVKASSGPVIAAGSVVDPSQISTLCEGRSLGLHHRRGHLRGPVPGRSRRGRAGPARARRRRVSRVAQRTVTTVTLRTSCVGHL